MKTFTSLLGALALLSMTALLPLVNAVPVDEVAPRAGGAKGAVTIQCALCLFTLCLPALWPCEYVCAASEFIASECRSCMVQHRATGPCLAAFDAKCAPQNLLGSTVFLRVGLGVPAPGGTVAVS